jgi:hypothetical protein
VRGDAFPAPATAWDRDEAVTLHAADAPFGALRAGALVVGRGIPLGASGIVLVGPPVVVDEDAVADVLGVLRACPADALCAALRWPEFREHTAEGELVQQCLRTYEVADPDAVVASLRGCSMAGELDVLGYDEDDVTFEVRGSAGGTQAVEPAAERGVRWRLCDEDREDPPRLGEVTVSPAEGEVVLSAPTQARVEQLLRALPWALASSLGQPVRDERDQPDIMTRVTRDRFGVPLPAAA